MRGDVEKSKKKVEQDLKMTQEAVEDLERVKRDLEENSRKKDQEMNNLNNRLEDDASLINQLQKKIKELQVQSVYLSLFFRETHIIIFGVNHWTYT